MHHRVDEIGTIVKERPKVNVNRCIACIKEYDFFGHFCTLMKTEVFFETAGSVPLIAISLKSNQVKLVLIRDTRTWWYIKMEQADP